MSNRIFDIADQYDVIVVGAGVAGGFAGLQLARRGYSVLIVEAKKFPREKVCGCCLNQRGVQILGRAGLVDNLRQLNGMAIDQWQLNICGRRFLWRIPEIIATRRSSFDEMLVHAAERAGAAFLEHTSAHVLPTQTIGNESRDVELQGALGARRIIRGRIVLVADGLTRSSLKWLTEFSSKVKLDSKIGVQALISLREMPDNFRDRLCMFVDKQGYVGIVPVNGASLDDEMIDIAAALDTNLINKSGGIRATVCNILDACKVPISQSVLDSATWRATPRLTQRSTRCGSHRIFLLGDSLGYV